MRNKQHNHIFPNQILTHSYVIQIHCITLLGNDDSRCHGKGRSRREPGQALMENDFSKVSVFYATVSNPYFRHKTSHMEKERRPVATTSCISRSHKYRYTDV
jgi:hypothetical protein